MVADRELLQFFGKRLRAARHAAHLSQTGLARRLQLGQDTISHYEGGQCRPDLTTLARLAAALNVSISYFFPDAGMGAFDEAERETLALLKRLSPATACAILQLIRQCADAECHQHLLLQGIASERDARHARQRWLARELHRLRDDAASDQRADGLLHLNTLLILLTSHAPLDQHPRAARRLTGMMQDWLTTYLKEPA
jgi:transcriptional regulator with XRE-family HTH domain